MCGFTKAIPVTLEGSAKDSGGWLSLETAQVYHDHFIKANLEGGVVLDFLRTEGGASGLQMCMEMSKESALALAQAIMDTVAQIPEEEGADAHAHAQGHAEAART